MKKNKKVDKAVVGVGNREQWLSDAVKLMTPLFEQHGYKVPAVRVACGWPSVKALSAKSRRIGECWSTEAAEDGVSQIFISPWLDDPSGVQGILPTLVHEVVHAVVGNKEGHNKVFGKCARAVGLEGKLTATIAGETLVTQCKDWAKQLGAYPHAQLDSLKSPRKKQTTRLVKAECECGYNVRVTRKWLEEVGAPICPHNKKVMSYEIPDELDSDEGEGEE